MKNVKFGVIVANLKVILPITETSPSIPGKFIEVDELLHLKIVNACNEFAGIQKILHDLCFEK